jgi:hypothetical protein
LLLGLDGEAFGYGFDVFGDGVKAFREVAEGGGWWVAAGGLPVAEGREVHMAEPWAFAAGAGREAAGLSATLVSVLAGAEVAIGVE